MHRLSLLIFIALLGWAVTACGQDLESTPIRSRPPAPTAQVVEASQTPADTATQASTVTSAPASAPSATPAPESTLTPSPAPTYGKLRGEVIVDQANCRYGPGFPYLYKYGVIKGSNLDIIGRNEPGTWIEIQAIGGHNPCWLKANLMKIKGDVMAVPPILPETVRLPASPYYGPLSGVSAQRSGSEVTVSWRPLVLRAGDDSEQFPYLVEAWVCQAGQLVFTPVGSYQTAVKINDEPGCPAPSHGRVYGVEKHGYTKWIEISWPVFQASPAP